MKNNKIRHANHRCSHSLITLHYLIINGYVVNRKKHIYRKEKCDQGKKSSESDVKDEDQHQNDKQQECKHEQEQEELS